ncbi:MAG: low molecular weight protein arginine phosphatase [Oscillospiraceae bacterium]|jgi:protein-tyrosine-phosphatase|nr:low molecular weight protein arginine phosphatase [Oscillospiraceae bacterium]
MNYYGKITNAANAPQYILLFVCSGNTCRSPMAEALTRAWLDSHIPDHAGRFRVMSAGLAARPGSSVSEGAAEAVTRHGCMLEGHRARAFTPEMARGAQVIAMTRSHAAIAKSAAPGAKVTTLAAWAGQNGGWDILDPFMGSDAEYRACCDQIGRLIDLGLRRMLNM